MSKKAKLITWITLIAVVVVCAGYFGARAIASSPYQQAGKLYGESVKNDDTRNQIAISGKDFSITTQELDNLIAQNEVSAQNHDEAQQLALSQFIVRRSLYYRALEEGYGVEDAAVQAQIESDRTGIAQASNVQDFLDYIAAAGMTEDEYWESMTDTYRRNLTISAYTEALYDQYLEQGGSTTDTDAWDAYCMNVTRQAIEAQEIQLADGLSWELTNDNYKLFGVWPQPSL